MIDLMDYIPTGKANAISSTELARLCSFNSTRDLQQEIERHRNAGAVICSSYSGGYYFHSNIHELREYVHTQENRGVNTLRSLESAKLALAELEANV